MAETIGSLIDKLAIINLKIYHMGEQCERRDVSKDHIQACTEKKNILKIQQQDLSLELNDLFHGVMNGVKKMKIYRQYKMYNDPKYILPAEKNS